MPFRLVTVPSFALPSAGPQQRYFTMYRGSSFLSPCAYTNLCQTSRIRGRGEKENSPQHSAKVNERKKCRGQPAEGQTMPCRPHSNLFRLTYASEPLSTTHASPSSIVPKCATKTSSYPQSPTSESATSRPQRAPVHLGTVKAIAELQYQFQPRRNIPMSCLLGISLVGI
ncbi:hypothetical protein F4777DRAFT_249578 [Nemania sp. FL0916]|nr:hypothetical protein F4777DRAFT_249578 [Nemania sp. FL0916]